MKVVTTSLQQTAPPATAPRPFPPDARLNRVDGITPEYARFLYALVGGPWHWIDRLSWTREHWLAELAVLGGEFHVVSLGGAPVGYIQLHPETVSGRSEVEIRYFGLAEQAIGRGLGGALLEHGIAAAWTLDARHGIPPTSRVWVHTCTLDGPAALANYRARGLEVFDTLETEEDVADEPLGSWRATGGPGVS